MRRVFISQPMNGKSEEQIQETRTRIINKIQEELCEEIEVIDIIDIIDVAPKTASSLWYLGESIKLLSQADVAYFAKGWERYRGCKIEHIACTEYGIKTMYE